MGICCRASRAFLMSAGSALRVSAFDAWRLFASHSGGQQFAIAQSLWAKASVWRSWPQAGFL